MAKHEADRMWNPDAERSVLGAVLLRNEALDGLELEPVDFFHPAHRDLFAAMRRLGEARKPIDPVTLEAELERRGVLEAVGGLAYLAELVTSVPTADNVGHYAGLVFDAARLRRVRLAATNVVERLAREDLTADEAEALFVEQAMGLEKRRRDESCVMRELVVERAKEYGRTLERRQNGEPLVAGVPTGLEDLDWALGGGLPEGVLTILGGRPSTGKSSLARTIADNASAAGFGVHVFSLEDRQGTYADRCLADRARLNLQRLRSVDFHRGEWGDVQRATIELFERKNWRVDDSTGLSSAQIATRVRRHKRELGTKLVIVDYVQLMQEPGVRERRLEVDKAARGLVALARSENLVVVLLSQLTRANEREQRRPRMSDLRESGDLEQHARVILFTHHETDDKGRIDGEVIVAKQTNGPRDVNVKLYWDAPTATYRPRARRLEAV